MTRFAATWQSRTHSGAEPAITDAILERDGSGWFSSVMGVGLCGGKPWRLVCQLTWDRTWTLRQGSIDIPDGFPEAIRLRHDGLGSWTNGLADALRNLDECLDLIIGESPLCWTALIRRLNLKAGESRSLTIGFLDIPALTSRQAEITLTCELVPGEGEGGEGRFALTLPDQDPATVTTDRNGLVNEFPRWRRIYQGEFAPEESGTVNLGRGEPEQNDPPAGTDMG